MLARRSRDAVPQKAETAPFASKATDLQALRDAVVDAAGVGTGLWFSYLFVLFYFAIAAGAVTHRDLLLENPVKLPFLNVELPLKAFFILGPLVFLIVHAYVLLHFVLLAGKIGAFHSELEWQVKSDDTRAHLRRQLPSNIFVQSLAGPRDVRKGPIGFLLWLVIGISLIAGPIALLALFQLQFLPYHSEWITNWQRIAVVIDLVLLWILWPSVARGETRLLVSSDFKRVKVLAWLGASTLPVLLTVTIATFPGEWLEENLPTVWLVPTTWQAWTAPSIEAIEKPGSGWATLHQLLVAGAVNLVTDSPTSLWSNVLVLPDFKAGDRVKLYAEGKIAIGSDTVSLRGRDLRGAVFVRADLAKADFTGTQLDGADFHGADLREAKFECAWVGIDEKCAQLRGASLYQANLRGASLLLARLQGADIQSAQLQGADLRSTQLQAANLAGAELRGADLGGAELPGVDLSGAQLQGTHFAVAWLQGASLQGARLQGADLGRAQLQGSDLTGTELDAANIDYALVWRAQPPQKDVAKQVWGTPIVEAKSFLRGCSNAEELCDWTPASFAALQASIEKEAPPSFGRDQALHRITVLKQPPNPADQTIADRWGALSDPHLARAEYLAALASTLQKTFCAEESAPEAAAGLIRQLDFRFKDDTRDEAGLAEAFLDKAKCPSASGLSEETKATLREIRDRAKTPLAAGAASR